MAKVVTYGSNSITVADDVTVEQARTALSRFYPDVQNASHTTDDNGNITFSIKSGSKGLQARLVIGDDGEAKLVAI